MEEIKEDSDEYKKFIKNLKSGDIIYIDVKGFKIPLIHIIGELGRRCWFIKNRTLKTRQLTDAEIIDISKKFFPNGIRIRSGLEYTVKLKNKWVDELVYIILGSSLKTKESLYLVFSNKKHYKNSLIPSPFVELESNTYLKEREK